MTLHMKEKHSIAIPRRLLSPEDKTILAKQNVPLPSLPSSKRPLAIFRIWDSHHYPIERVILVDQQAYSSANTSTKYTVARTIGKLNFVLRDNCSGLMLIGPGRWGTTTPQLGVPVSFAEISNFKVLGEVAFESAGFVPELSFGSHFFQDLVKTDIFYLAIFPNDDYIIYSPQLFRRLPVSC